VGIGLEKGIEIINQKNSKGIRRTRKRKNRDTTLRAGSFSRKKIMLLIQ
jgi:hypothetical protein